MSKTLEIIESEQGREYSVYSPDHEEPFEVTGYTLDVEQSVLVEDGALHLDVSRDEYFHVEERYNGKQVTISVADHEQGPMEFSVPLRAGYTFNELVSELGVPDTDEAREGLRHLPRVMLTMEYENGESEAVSVTIDGETHEL